MASGLYAADRLPGAVRDGASYHGEPVRGDILRRASGPQGRVNVIGRYHLADHQAGRAAQIIVRNIRGGGAGIVQGNGRDDSRDDGLRQYSCDSEVIVQGILYVAGIDRKQLWRDGVGAAV